MTDVVDEENIDCWICRSSRCTPRNPLVHGVCRCHGSGGWVHQKCIDYYVLRTFHNSCPICQAEYRVYATVRPSEEELRAEEREVKRIMNAGHRLSSQRAVAAAQQMVMRRLAKRHSQFRSREHPKMPETVWESLLLVWRTLGPKVSVRMLVIAVVVTVNVLIVPTIVGVGFYYIAALTSGSGFGGYAARLAHHFSAVQSEESSGGASGSAIVGMFAPVFARFGGLSSFSVVWLLTAPAHWLINSVNDNYDVRRSAPFLASPPARAAENVVETGDGWRQVPVRLLGGESFASVAVWYWWVNVYLLGLFLCMTVRGGRSAWRDWTTFCLPLADMAEGEDAGAEAPPAPAQVDSNHDEQRGDDDEEWVDEEEEEEDEEEEEPDSIPRAIIHSLDACIRSWWNLGYLLEDVAIGLLAACLMALPDGPLLMGVVFVVVTVLWRWKLPCRQIRNPQRRFEEVMERKSEIRQQDVLLFFVTYVVDILFFSLLLPICGGVTLHYCTAPFLVAAPPSVYAFLSSLSALRLVCYWVTGTALSLLLLQVESTVVVPLFAPGVDLFFVRSVDPSVYMEELFKDFTLARIFDADPLRTVRDFVIVTPIELMALAAFVCIPVHMVMGMREWGWGDITALSRVRAQQVDERGLPRAHLSLLEPFGPWMKQARFPDVADARERLGLSASDWWILSQKLSVWDRGLPKLRRLLLTPPSRSRLGNGNGARTKASVSSPPLLLLLQPGQKRVFGDAAAVLSAHHHTLNGSDELSTLLFLVHEHRDVWKHCAGQAQAEQVQHPTATPPSTFEAHVQRTCAAGVLWKCGKPTAVFPLSPTREWEDWCTWQSAFPFSQSEPLPLGDSAALPNISDSRGGRSHGRAVLSSLLRFGHLWGESSSENFAKHLLYTQPLVSATQPDDAATAAWRIYYARGISLLVAVLSYAETPEAQEYRRSFQATDNVSGNTVGGALLRKQLSGVSESGVLSVASQLVQHLMESMAVPRPVEPEYTHPLGMGVLLLRRLGWWWWPHIVSRHLSDFVLQHSLLFSFVLRAGVAFGLLSVVICFFLFPVRRTQLKLMRPLVVWLARRFALEAFLFERDRLALVDDYLRAENDDDVAAVLVMPAVPAAQVFVRRERLLPPEAIPPHLHLRRLAYAVAFFAISAMTFWAVPVAIAVCLFAVVPYTVPLIVATLTAIFAVWRPQLYLQALFFTLLSPFIVVGFVIVEVTQTLQLVFVDMSWASFVRSVFHEYYHLRETVGPYDEDDDEDDNMGEEEGYHDDVGVDHVVD